MTPIYSSTYQQFKLSQQKVSHFYALIWKLLLFVQEIFTVSMINDIWEYRSLKTTGVIWKWSRMTEFWPEI